MALKIVTRKLSDLIVDPDNAREHDERNLDAIAHSLDTYGQVLPILIDKDNKVLGGNGTLAAAKQLGWDTLDATICTAVGDKARALAIALNRSAELASWKNDQLLATLSGFDDAMLSVAGFTLGEVDDLRVLHSDADDLDKLAADLGDPEEGTSVRLVFNVSPDVAVMWRAVCDSTGIAHPDAAAEAVIKAAFAGVTSE